MPPGALAVAEHDLLWMQTYNSPANDTDRAEAVAVDSEGNVYVAGWTRRLDVGENDNILLIKYSPSGDLLWLRTHNSFPDGADYAFGVAVADDGGVYLAGTVDTVGSGFDGWIRKYNPDGTVDTNFGTSGSVTYNSPSNDWDVFYDVAVDGTGNVVVAGYEYREPTCCNANWLIQKYDSAGVLLWSRTYNGPPADEFDTARSVTIASNGDVVVAGYETIAPANTDLVVRRYTADGILKWHKGYGSDDPTAPVPTPALDRAYGVAVDAKGDVYVAATVEPELPTNSRLDRWIRKYSADGTQVLWTRQIPSEGNLEGDSGRDCAVDRSGRFYVTGGSTRTDLFQGWNLIVELYDQANGAPVHATGYDSGNFPDPRDEFGRGIAVDQKGNYIVVGYEERDDLNQDLNWVVRKYAGPVVTPPKLSNLKVGPNPFKPAGGKVLTFYNLPAGATVRLYTIRGYLVKELHAPFEWNGLNDRAAPVATGLYLYVVSAPGEAQVRGKVALVRP